MGYYWRDYPDLSEYVDDETDEKVGWVSKAGPCGGLGTRYHIQGPLITPLEGGYPALDTAKTAVANQVWVATHRQDT